MMIRICAVIVSALGAWSTAGCASIFASGPDAVQVSSNPEGARVKLDEVPMGKTPCVVMVPRSSDGVFTFELPGYRTETVDLDKVVNGMTFLNLLWGIYLGPVGFLIDGVSGNIGKYPNTHIHAELRPVPIEP